MNIELSSTGPKGRSPTAWLLSVFGEERQYAGNKGYEDDVLQRYEYDSNVANHLRMGLGDLVVLRDPTKMLGVASIHRIDEVEGIKIQLRCTEANCGTTSLKERTSKSPRYRCSNGHEFQTPIVREIDVVKKTAFFGNSFRSAPSAVPLEDLRDCCPRRSDQLSIQELSVAAVIGRLLAARSDLADLVHMWRGPLPPNPDEADGNEASSESEDDAGSFNALAAASDYGVFAQIRRRRGQAAFRNALRNRYGDRCMLSGAVTVDVIEAAHILPYVSRESNNPANGILLRSDLHTLWDLGRFAIHPETLQIELDHSLASGEYRWLEGQQLRVPSATGPSKAALRFRWQVFLDRRDRKEERS
jgi:putative restriction endonuclease